MNVLLFGVLADITGRSTIEMEAKDIDSLKVILSTQYPALIQHRFQFAVNREIIKNNIALKYGDEVALLPPFAGG